VVADVLDRLELRPLADRSVGTLSGGERQRCLLARALAQEAGLLLLDEPTTGLDLGHQTHVLDVVEDLRAERGLTVVATMHDLTLASHHADRLVLLADGRAVATGTPAEVLDAGILSACYGTRVRVLHDEGVLIVVPAPSINAGRSGSGE
jgi:iron complex transport system ATP-binding protein